MRLAHSILPYTCNLLLPSTPIYVAVQRNQNPYGAELDQGNSRFPFFCFTTWQDCCNLGLGAWTGRPLPVPALLAHPQLGLPFEEH